MSTQTLAQRIHLLRLLIHANDPLIESLVSQIGPDQTMKQLLLKNLAKQIGLDETMVQRIDAGLTMYDPAEKTNHLEYMQRIFSSLEMQSSDAEYTALAIYHQAQQSSLRSLQMRWNVIERF